MARARTISPADAHHCFRDKHATALRVSPANIAFDWPLRSAPRQRGSTTTDTQRKIRGVASVKTNLTHRQIPNASNAAAENRHNKSPTGTGRSWKGLKIMAK